MLAWFDITHRVVPIGGGLSRWERIGLPRAGGIDVQEEKLMAALDHLLLIRETLLRREQAPVAAPASRGSRV